MFKKSVICFVSTVFCAVVALPLLLSAQSADVSYTGDAAYLSVERTNVTARKGSPSDSFRAAANVTVIERADIEKLGASTLVDVLRLEQGIIIRDWTGAGKTVGIDLRGFGETGASNVLVLVNGRRVNPIDMAGVDWAQIPLSAVERIEIIRGPSAVLYGDNATGGVINIITARPTQDKTDFSAAAGSYNSSALRLGFSGRKSDTSYKVVASRNSTDGFRENSGVANSDINAFIVRETPKVKTSLDFGFHLDKYGMPGSLNEADWEAGKLTRTSSPLDEARTSDSYIQVSVESPLSPKVKNELTLSSRNRLASEYGRSWMSGSERKSDTTGVGNKVRLDDSPVGSVVGGLEAYFSGQNIKNLDKNDIPTVGGATIKKDSLAFYVNDNAKLLDDKLSVEAGLRYEMLKYSFASAGADDVRLSSAAQAYSVGASYLADENTSVYAKWSSAFRAPTVDEYCEWGSFNLDLQNQITNTSELGLKKIFGKKLSGNLAIFQTATENEIYYNPAGGLFGSGSNENYKKTQRLGAELGAIFSPTKIYSLRANYTYTDAKITEGDYKNSVIPAVPAHSASLINTLTSGRYIVSLAGNYVGERYFISDQRNVSPKLPAHVRADVKASYALDGVRIFVGVNNVLDAKYAEYGHFAEKDFLGNVVNKRTYYPSPERNFFGGVEVVF